MSLKSTKYCLLELLLGLEVRTILCGRGGDDVLYKTHFKTPIVR